MPFWRITYRYTSFFCQGDIIADYFMDVRAQ